MKLVLVIFLIISFEVTAKTNSAIKHICPLNENPSLEYPVESRNSVIRKEICNLYEINDEYLNRAKNGEIIAKFLKTDKKVKLNFIMIAYIPADYNIVADTMLDLEKLEQLLPVTSNYCEFRFNSLDEFELKYPDYLEKYPDVDLFNSQFYTVKVKFGVGPFKTKEYISKQTIDTDNSNSRSVFTHLIKSKKIFHDSFNIIKTFPYGDGSIMISYSEDHIKHPMAEIVIGKIKKSAKKSAKKFALDLIKMLEQ